VERARTWNGTFWRRHWSGVASALVALGAVLLPTWGCAEEPIRIGVLSSLTGPATYAGEPGPKTIQLYAKKINEAGGMLGRKLQVISYDDKRRGQGQ
jgi:branched-chain amino acid transport system substrate-binding protein